MRKTVLGIVLAAGAAGLSGAAYLWLRSPGISVEVGRAAPGEIEEIVTAVSEGTVKSRREATLSAETAGRVLAVRKDVGDPVRRDELLARLADPELSRRAESAEAEIRQVEELERQAAARREEAERRLVSEIARAESDRQRAEEEYRRAGELFRKGYLSRAEMDRAENLLVVAQEAERTARAGELAVRAIERETASLRARAEGSRAAHAALLERVRKLSVVAPFDGIVTRRTVEEGEAKQPGEPLFQVADPRDLYVEAPVDESDSAKVRVGQPVRLYPDAYLGETFPGTVSEVIPLIEVSKEVSRANTIRVEVPNPPRPLRLGMSVDVEVITGRKAGVLRVPSSAVMEREGKKFVFTVRDGRAARSDIEAGISNWDWTEVRSGLSGGEPVILSLEAKNLREGSRVDVRERR